MSTNIAEIVGIFLAVIGAGSIVGAAALVSTALAVLAAGCFLLFAGVLTIVVANAADAAKRSQADAQTAMRIP